MKKRKHLLTAGCLVTGLLVLSTAVYANYDDAKGYSNYKEALKDLAFEQTNYSIDYKMGFSFDGKDLQNITGKLKYDNGDQSHEMSLADNMRAKPDSSKVIQYHHGKQSTYYDVDTNMYSQYEDSASTGPAIPLNESVEKKAVRFVELMADTMVGDLKNNIVLNSVDEDGVRNYSIDVSGNQIPEVVNAGLSLMFTAYNTDSSNRDGMIMRASYENDLTDEQWESYQDVLENKNYKGVVYILEDGSYEYYKTYDEYKTAVLGNSVEPDDIFIQLGESPYIDSVVCKVGIDKEGRLVSNYLEASLVGKDKNGKKHVAKVVIDASIFDYGNTAADVFDPAGKVLR